MEKKRQVIHIGMVGFAFLLAWLPRWGALLCAVAAFVFNAFVMPRLSKDTFRDGDLKKGYSTGILLYPISVFVLILLFPAYIAAGAWAVMALGDGAATLAGIRPGLKRLPWNTNKTWVGSITFFIAAAAGAYGLMLYTVHFHGPQEGFRWLAFLAVAAAGSAAGVESMDMKIDDNVTVPLCAGLVMWVLHFASVDAWGAYYSGALLPAVAVSLAVGLLSLAMGAVDVWGFLGGVFIGFVIYYCAGWQGFLVLVSFFVVGTACTKAGYRIKVSRGVAQEKKGRRGLKHALANCSVGAVFAFVFSAVSLGQGALILSHNILGGGDVYSFEVARAAALAFVSAFAAAAADTVSSELGQVLGKKPVMITTFKAVPHGTNGGITLTGTLLGTVGAVAVTAAGVALGFVPASLMWLPVAAAFFGMNLDSVIGAAMENKGLVNNEFVNLCCTAGAALLAFVAYMAMMRFLSAPVF